MADEEKKIFIDEGWKAQVEREREEARLAAEQAPAEDEGDDEAGEAPTLFQGLVQTLAAQALFALGAMGPQDGKQVYVDLVESKHCIDTVQMLREKTEGNLSPEESGQLAEILAELQRVYVVRAQQVQEAALRQGMPNASKPPRA